LIKIRSRAHQPAFRQGEIYRFLREDTVPAYIFLDLMGKPRCVPEREFERLDA